MYLGPLIVEGLPHCSQLCVTVPKCNLVLRSLLQSLHKVFSKEYLCCLILLLWALLMIILKWTKASFYPSPSVLPNLVLNINYFKQQFDIE